MSKEGFAMSEHELNRSPLMRSAEIPQQQQQQQGTDSLHNVTLEDTPGAANTSIIGKVRTRVSSILPNSLSKWFSPSSKTSAETVNGGMTRRRRRLELEDDDEADEEEEEECLEGEEEQEIELNDRATTHAGGVYNDELLNVEQADNSDEDEMADEHRKTSTVLDSRRQMTATNRAVGLRPPCKRSRLNWNDSDMLQPNMVSSTPAATFSTPTVNVARSKGRYSSYLNLYANQSKKEPAYDFQAAVANMETPLANSSRRTLNIPTTPQSYASSSLAANPTERYANFSNLTPTKRKSIGSMRDAYLPKPHTATTIVEIDTAEDDDDIPSTSKGLAVRINGPYATRTTTAAAIAAESFRSQRKKLNGSAVDEEEGEADAPLRDSASECSEGAESSIVAAPSKTGLYNVSSLKSGRNSRTSSFGNGLNFNSHLEGRKSLFAGNQTGSSVGQNFNNSTMSLTSLNRRQFNASIYGSTSALSDSRLLNTFSPFYKGKTTYGGAAAYNKFGLRGTGAGATHITPTLIRPTSSLSTLSSSCNSLAAATASGIAGTSSTAARLLEMINDFTTPLRDVKKMANSINMPAQQKPRLCEADLQASRALRLSKVSTPYERPRVTRSNVNGLAASLPPVRELQVPSMSQLLQMKKFQKTTERARQITMQSEDNCAVPAASNAGIMSATEYTLPPTIESSDAADAAIAQQSHTHSHTNKIKNKITGNVARVSNKQAIEEAAPAPLNLPNITFPLMQSVPKIDITLPAPAVTSNSTSSTTMKTVDKQQSNWATVQPASNVSKPKAAVNFEFNAPGKLYNNVMPNVAASAENFKFSSVEKMETLTMPMTSPPSKTADKSMSKKQPTLQLKSGSVLDALKKPLASAASTTEPAASKPLPLSAQFKQASDEWNCDVCMLRNKKTNNKCVACGNPQPGVAVKPVAAVAGPTTLSSNSFGATFKPKTDEWSCPTCLIYNKKQQQECVACQTKQPGSTSTTTAVTAGATALSNFKFGFAAATSSIPSSVASTATDVGFKTLVQQQKAAKWECEACMTRNDDTRLKCICCEQAKPGTLNSAEGEAPKFAFGATSKSKFNFGFPGNTSTETDLKNAPTTTTTTNALPAIKEKTETASTGFVFGVQSAAVATENKTAAIAPTGFSFGIKPTTAATTATTTSKTVDSLDSNAVKNANVSNQEKTDSKAGFGGFQFGSTTTATSVTGSGFNFGTPTTNTTSPSTASAISTTSAVTSTAMVNNFTNVKFNLSGQASTTTTNTTTATEAAPTFSFGTVSTKAPAIATATPTFSFGTTSKNTTEAMTNNNTQEQQTKSAGFNFSTPATTSSSATNTFAFGSTPAATTSSTATTTSTATNIKPMFSFGSTTAASGSGGFNFGNPSSSAASSSNLGTFGSTASKTTAGNNENIFGAAFASAEGKPTAVTQPIFGNVSSSSSNNPPAATVSPFAFSSSAATNADNAATSANSTNTAWPPKNSFGFGNANTATNATATANINSSNATTSKNIFGGFTATPANVSTTGFDAPTTSATSVFGRLGSPITTTATAKTTTSSIVFGSGSANTLLGAQGANNLFAVPAASTASAPAFGSTLAFGSGGGSTFGSAATNANTFGGFGASSSSTTDGATAAKKADVSSTFNFGAPPAQGAATSGFNFGPAATTAKPAFNFTASNPPAFNFTGSAEASAMNAPFQFNAGATPASNIFAPTPIPGTPTTAQQARRKIRPAMRRLNPR